MPGRTTLCNAAVAGSNPACPARAVAQSGRAPAPRGRPSHSRRRDRRTPWRMPDGLHSLSRPRCGFDWRRAGQSARSSTEEQGCPSNTWSPRTNSKLANAGGTTSVRPKGRAVRIRPEAIRDVPSNLVASTRTAMSANAGGTTWERALADRQEVGGSNPPPGNRIAQKQCLAMPRRRRHDYRGRSQ